MKLQSYLAAVFQMDHYPLSSQLKKKGEILKTVDCYKEEIQ